MQIGGSSHLVARPATYYTVGMTSQLGPRTPFSVAFPAQLTRSRIWGRPGFQSNSHFSLMPGGEHSLLVEPSTASRIQL